MQSSYDFILVGGGLSGGLLAHRLTTVFPKASVLVLERDTKLGGQHTWSFHETDIPASAREWFLPLASQIWPSHSVHFPKHSRNLEGRYGSIRSEDFDRQLRSNSSLVFRFGTNVSEILPTEVSLKSGEKFSARCVFDCRGFEAIDPDANAYQKFLGLTVRLEAPHGLKAPILMDATLPQIDGYRFMYALPWTEKEVLLEDTYYSQNPHLPKELIRQRIETYIQEKGWRVEKVLGEEEGVLPIPYFEAYLKGGKETFHSLSLTKVPSLGVRAGHFNRTTGFSLPQVLEAIERLVKIPVLNPLSAQETLKAFYLEKAPQHRWFCFLNRMLFWGTDPALRYQILEQFYLLPEELISKFYAVRMGLLDWFKFFFRKPPIPIGKALQSGFKKRVLSHV